MRHFQILGNGSSIHFLFWSFITFALGEGVRNWKTGKWDDIDNLSTWKWWNCRTFPTNITYPHTHTCISIYINIYIYMNIYPSIYLSMCTYQEKISSLLHIYLYISKYIYQRIFCLNILNFSSALYFLGWTFTFYSCSKLILLVELHEFRCTQQVVSVG